MKLNFNKFDDASFISSKKAIHTDIVSIARVEHVFLTNTEYNGETIPPGSVEVSFIGIPGTRIAYPFDLLTINLPFQGERVETFSLGITRYYRRIDDTKTLFSNGITGNDSKINDNQVSIDIGNTITHRLKLNPGDFLIQSRFGQSIRFSGLNNKKQTISPTLIIRNNESIQNRVLPETNTVDEDINTDGSTISLTSGDYQSNFLPGTITNGKSNFKLKVYQTTSNYGMEKYPSKLDGNQIIISSDRLILSSRINEMIFWSKEQCAVITDSIFSVDSYLGMNFISQDGGIDFQAKENAINFNVGKKGVIHLGIGEGKELSKAIDGVGLVEVLGKILDELENMANAGIMTPSGPTTGLNPITGTQQRIASLRNSLTSLLSETVFISK